jgi:hypothetical protein
MKNTLAENMLRFAPKNLGAKDIKTLKRLAEQTPNTPVTTQQTGTKTGPVSLNQIDGFQNGGRLSSQNATVITTKFNKAPGTIITIANDKAIAQPLFGTYTIIGGTCGDGKPVPNQFFITDLIYTGPYKSGAPTNTGAAARDIREEAPGILPAIYPLKSTVIGTLQMLKMALGKVGPLQQQLTNTILQDNVAKFISECQRNGIILFTDYDEKTLKSLVAQYLS